MRRMINFYNLSCSKIHDVGIKLLYLNSDFIILKCESNTYPFYELHMNGSIKIYLESLLIDYPQAIFLVTCINMFQHLNCKLGTSYIDYYTISHSLTIYYLRILERLEIITIHWCKKQYMTGEFNEEYKSIGNSSPKREKAIYDICFSKMRSLEEKDIESIKKIEKIFHIPEELISFKLKSGKLIAKLNLERVIKERLKNFKLSPSQNNNRKKTDEKNNKI